jgi:hypothetical protein
MKKILLAGLMCLLALSLTGCIIYGKGESNGYVYAIDDGIVWDKVWFKPSMASTESDCYLIKDDSIKEELRNLKAGTNIKIHYSRHLFTMSSCPDGTETNDEITAYELVN